MHTVRFLYLTLAHLRFVSVRYAYSKIKIVHDAQILRTMQNWKKSIRSHYFESQEPIPVLPSRVFLVGA